MAFAVYQIADAITMENADPSNKYFAGFMIIVLISGFFLIFKTYRDDTRSNHKMLLDVNQKHAEAAEKQAEATIEVAKTLAALNQSIESLSKKVDK